MHRLFWRRRLCVQRARFVQQTAEPFQRFDRYEWLSGDAHAGARAGLQHPGRHDHDPLRRVVRRATAMGAALPTRENEHVAAPQRVPWVHHRAQVGPARIMLCR
jgi:hypothetical protein